MAIKAPQVVIDTIEQIGMKNPKIITVDQTQQLGPYLHTNIVPMIDTGLMQAINELRGDYITVSEIMGLQQIKLLREILAELKEIKDDA